MYPQQEK